LAKKCAYSVPIREKETRNLQLETKDIFLKEYIVIMEKFQNNYLVTPIKELIKLK